MQRVHFTGIGESSMLNIAIALSRKNSYMVSGSDETFSGQAYSRLIENGLWPESQGWHPERIQKTLNAVVTGTHIHKNNPELQRAIELGLKIYTFPEFLYQQTRSKTRIVISGSYGVASTTAMILHVLRKLKIPADYLTSAQGDKQEMPVVLSYESRIAVFEDSQPDGDTGIIFKATKPHIAVFTGIAAHNTESFLNFSAHTNKFCELTELMEVQGRLIYHKGDENLGSICKKLRRDIVSFGYEISEHEIQNSVTFLKTKNKKIPLLVFGTHNLLNINAARLACRQIGIYDEQFYNSISDFEGLRGRLTKLAENNDTIVYGDTADSPTKLKACIRAIKEQYPSHNIIACYELPADNQDADYLPLYASSFQLADTAILYYKPANTKNKDIEDEYNKTIRNAFGLNNNAIVVHDIEDLKNSISKLDLKNSIIIFAGPHNFSNNAGVLLTEKKLFL